MWQRFCLMFTVLLSFEAVNFQSRVEFAMAFSAAVCVQLIVAEACIYWFSRFIVQSGLLGEVRFAALEHVALPEVLLPGLNRL